MRHLVGSMVFAASAALLMACGSEPPTASTPEVTAAVTPDPRDRPKPKDRTPEPDEALDVGAMLADELFQALVASVDGTPVAEPLLRALEALDADRTGRAVKLLQDAADAADALDDQSDAGWETRISWSVLEQYLEAAELL